MGLLIGVGVAAFLIGLMVGWLVGRDKGVGPVSTPAASNDALVIRAGELAHQAEQFDAGGEYKRHWVYARLIKEFPGERKRAISRAIESALGD